MQAVLEITIDEEMALEDFIANLNRMFGEGVMSNVIGSTLGEVKFFGLTKTGMDLAGLDKHLRLIDSYKKLHQARKTQAAS